MTPPIILGAEGDLGAICDLLSIISVLLDPGADLQQKDRADLALLIGELARRQHESLLVMAGAPC
jgi:hypothetical protein